MGQYMKFADYVRQRLDEDETAPLPAVTMNKATSLPLKPSPTDPQGREERMARRKASDAKLRDKIPLEYINLVQDVVRELGGTGQGRFGVENSVPANDLVLGIVNKNHPRLRGLAGTWNLLDAMVRLGLLREHTTGDPLGPYPIKTSYSLPGRFAKLRQ